MEDMVLVRLQCLLLGKKLVKASELEEAAARGALLQIFKEMRETLILEGLRKRKTRKPKTDQTAIPAQKKPRK